MNISDSSSFRDTENAFPLARIDAQDESYILPLREYLETHGVDVVVNRVSDGVPLYHIVAGDATYVKQILSRDSARGTKQLGIILGGGRVKEEFSGNVKIVTAYPTIMTATEVVEVFEFFFTEGKNHLDLRRRHEYRTLHEERERADDARVSSIIAEVYNETKPHRRKHTHAWVLGVCTGIGLLIIPAIWYGMSMVVGGIAIVSGAHSLREGNYRAVGWNIRVADYWLHQGEFVLNIAVPAFSWVGWEDALRGQQRLMSFMKDAKKAENEAQALTTLASRVAGGLVNQVDATSTEKMTASDVSQLRISLYTLGNTLGLAQAELSMLLSDRTFPFSIGAIADRGMTAVSDLTDIRQSAGDIDKLMSLFLSLAGFKEPRTYLILLQNSMELRPTGGFIGSVAIATFGDGRLTNLDIQDVYTFDGQLKGHVDPPIPIKELLDQEHWYLRDSNWDPDFKEAGTRATWFYEKETGAAVDGVIGISTPFIIDILNATGPIDLVDYQDRITADNFYGKSIYYTQNDFFPGSTQKKDFLGSLSRAMLNMVTTGKNVNAAKLFRAITTALTGHDILMMFANSELQSIVEHYGWAGRVPPNVGCTGTDIASCTFDPMMSVEANVGVNKVNYFVTRTFERVITVNPDGSLGESMTVTVRNTSGSQEKNLPYRTYIRFLVPKNARESIVQVDGTPVPLRSGQKLPALPYAEASVIASGQSTIGVALEAPASTERKVMISYTEGRPISFGKSGAVLDVFTQKQPGVSATPLHTVVRYPQDWTAGVESRDFIAKQGQLEYNTTLDRDALTRIRFTKP